MASAIRLASRPSRKGSRANRRCKGGRHGLGHGRSAVASLRREKQWSSASSVRNRAGRGRGLRNERLRPSVIDYRRVTASLARPGLQRKHRRDDAGNRLAAAQRARVFGGHGEEEAWFLADHFESDRRRPPLPHRDASRSLTWPSRRLMSRSRWQGFPPRRSSNCAASGGDCIGHRRRCGCPVIS
jgi:hypothetical protein